MDSTPGGSRRMAEMNNSEDSDRLSLDMLETALPTEVPTPSDDSDDECYEDATEEWAISEDMDLVTAIDETILALNLFMNNRFSEAKKRMEPWADRSCYHAVGYGTLMYLQAALTFEMSDIEAAVIGVKRAVRTCDRARRKHSRLNWSQKCYNSYTDDEVHAELCYAECLIMRALLTFVQDENLISFVKGSLKIRTCYQSYKECARILEKRDWKDETKKVHFESGVRLGIGLFNLMLSLLPTKILKLLEFVGFSGNKRLGLALLEQGSMQATSLRGPLCSLALLAYHTVMTYVLGTADGDIKLCERIIKPCLENYPKGALFLFFAGRIEEIKGNIDGASDIFQGTLTMMEEWKAIGKLEDSISAQDEWKQFHHLCYWELMWCHAYQGDWLLAMKYAERLCRESRWSRATYSYQKAAFLMMAQDTSPETQAHIDYLMGEVPKLKQRIAGKSIPIEKFAVRKAQRYYDQGKRLVLPALELIYVWNGFMILSKNAALLMPLVQQIEDAINIIYANKEKNKFFVDEYCLALLLKGVCLKQRGSDFQAEQCFREVWQYEKQLKSDTYLVPYALMELALLFMHTGNLDEAANIMQKAKAYKGYSLESRLHFRMHAAHHELKRLSNPDRAETEMSESGSSPPDSPVLNHSPTPPPSP